MSDENEKCTEPHSDRINTNDANEVNYWAERLGVSLTTLHAAVSLVGPRVKALEKFLK